MRNSLKQMAIVISATLFINEALAVPIDTDIINLPDKGTVMLSGTVEKVSSVHKFTLRDNSGAIEVNVAPEESATFKAGDKVTVSGKVERPWWGLTGKDIVAAEVQVHKDFPTALSDSIIEITGISPQQSQAFQISQLPKEGRVQLIGTINSVTDQKHFTLKDSTGTIGVNIQSNQNMTLVNGAQVTVTGYVHNGMLGKKIDAVDVILMSAAPANTGHMDAKAY